MASSTSGTKGSTDEMRYQSYLNQLERQQDADIKDKQDQHKEKVTRIVNGSNEQATQMKKDYDVRISEEAEALEKKLGMVRERNNIIVGKERENGELEADRIRMQYTQKIEQEKRVGDEQINRLQAYYKKAADELEQQYAKDKAKSIQKGRSA